MSDKDKNRIVKLQKAMKLAVGALEKAKYGDLSSSAAEDVLYEIGKLDWNSKPDLVQKPPRYI